MLRTDIMIDLEFTSLRYDAVLLSAGLVFFDVEKEKEKEGFIKDTMYLRFTLQDQLDLGRKIDEETLLWWLEQSNEAKREFTRDLYQRVDLQTGLRTIASARKYGVKRVWCHGTTTDLPLLFHIYDQLKIERPWHYRAPRDTKTLFDWYPDKEELGKVLKPGGETAHNALTDAVNQTNAVKLVWDYLVYSTGNVPQ